jgi:cobalt-zinc-cadmium efflux system membrane fusion protein
MTIRVPFLVASAALAVVAASCARPPADPPPPESTASDVRAGLVLDASAQQSAGITTQAAVEVPWNGAITAPGLIALDETRTARIGSLQEGLVLETLRQVGDPVRSGQLLATMHGHAVHDAWAGYRKAIADRRRLEKELAFATDALGRAQRLYAEKAIALQERQRAEVDHVTAREQLEMAQAEVRRSIEELEHIGIVIEDNGTGGGVSETTEQIPVKSPIRGVVLERLVTPGTTVTPGMPMFVVSDLSSLWAIAEVDEQHLSRLRVGQPVEVSVAAYGTETFHGTVSAIADMVNPKTRRITVRAVVPNTDGRLKPEMFATLALGDAEPAMAVVVPSSAVQSVDGQTVVFVAGEDDTFSPRQVVVGRTINDRVQVLSGLAAGESVAATGSFVLKSEMLRRADGGQ